MPELKLSVRSSPDFCIFLMMGTSSSDAQRIKYPLQISASPHPLAFSLIIEILSADQQSHSKTLQGI